VEVVEGKEIENISGPHPSHIQVQQ